MIARAILFVTVALVATAALLWSQWRTPPWHVSGIVEAHEVRVGSRVGGRIAKVHVEEGQTVQAGDPLVTFEPFELHERITEAEAMLAQARAEQKRLEAGYRPEEIAQAAARRDRLAANVARLRKGPRDQEIATGRARLELAEAQLRLAEQEQKRAVELHRTSIASAEALDRATTQLEVARAEAATRRQELALLLEGTRPEDLQAAEAELAEAKAAWQLERNGYRSEDIARARAAVAAAEASLAAWKTRLDEIVVEAPTTAVVEAVELRPGDIVPADAPLLSLLEPNSLWVRAYVPENRMALQLDQAVEVAVDSFPTRRFRGLVSFVARQGEFTPGNVQTPEERSKQVFRIKVALTSGLDVLRAGMAADVYLEPEP